MINKLFKCSLIVLFVSSAYGNINIEKWNEISSQINERLDECNRMKKEYRSGCIYDYAFDLSTCVHGLADLLEEDLKEEEVARKKEEEGRVYSPKEDQKREERVHYVFSRLCLISSVRPILKYDFKGHPRLKREVIKGKGLKQLVQQTVTYLHQFSDKNKTLLESFLQDIRELDEDYAEVTYLYYATWIFGYWKEVRKKELLETASNFIYLAVGDIEHKVNISERELNAFLQRVSEFNFKDESGQIQPIENETDLIRYVDALRKQINHHLSKDEEVGDSITPSSSSVSKEISNPPKTPEYGFIQSVKIINGPTEVQPGKRIKRK